MGVFAKSFSSLTFAFYSTADPCSCMKVSLKHLFSGNSSWEDSVKAAFGH